jgi:GTPase
MRRLSRLANRRTDANRIVSPELARALTELSREIQRQVGMLIDRRGHIRVVMVGDAKSVFIPDLSAYRRGRDRLCGLRLVHTHLKGEPLNDDDLTDLALLRLDMVAAIEAQADGLPGGLHAAHLVPDGKAEMPWEVVSARSVHEIPEDFLTTIDALEEEFARRRKPRAAGDTRERGLLVHVSNGTATDAADSMGELRDLARSAGIEVLGEIVQRRLPDPRFVLGKGRLKNTVIKAMQVGAEALIFDLNLSPSQVESLANFTDLKILDRTQVILDIFAQRAETREGMLQVELAQLRYMLPRLSTRHTALSRLTGGIGGRGPGETKLEVDRRRAGDRIAQLEREVKKLGRRRKLRRHARKQNHVPVVSIIGYTNVGKSTLLNQLTRSEVRAEDVLFATLNPVSRRLRFPREREIIITDTVGFIRRLPKELKAAFRTTFEELVDADLLLHVLDASSPEAEAHYETVRELLAELDLNRKPELIVLNKIDLCDAEAARGLARRFDAETVCARDQETLQPLLEHLEHCLWADERVRVPL